jgi:hypothetical protein
MEIPVRFTGLVRARAVRAAGFLVLGVLLASCAAGPAARDADAPVSLDRPQVSFPNGKVMLWLYDEDGNAMIRTKVDFAWEEPSAYRTMGFTDSTGRIVFNGVPEVANVSINHPGGTWERTLVVPQRGIAEMRVMLQTYGENRKMVNRLLNRPEQ